MLDRNSKRSFNFITSHVDAYSAAVADQLRQLAHGPGARLADPTQAALAVLQQRIGAQALLRAFNSNFMALALAFLCASVLILVMKRPRPTVVVDTNSH